MRLMKQLAAVLAACACSLVAQAQQVINVGAAPNDGTGDPVRTAFQKVNANFSADFVTLQPALSGIVTTSGNSNLTSITPASVTNSMLANMNASSFKCNSSGSAAQPSDCSLSTAQTLFASNSGGSGSVCFSGAATWVACSGGGGGGFPTLSMPATFSVSGSGTSTIAVTASGTSGGVPYFSTSSTLASSAALTLDQLMFGGGAGGAPLTLGSLGTTITVLHGNASGLPAFSALNFATDGTGIGSPANGFTGVNNGSKTITLGGNLTTSGAFNTTLTATAATNATLPPGTTNIGTMETLPSASGSPCFGTSYTAVLADDGHLLCNSSGSALTFTIPANSSVNYPVGTSLFFLNPCGLGTVTISINTDTMYLAGPGTTGSRTLAPCNAATAFKYNATAWMISGTLGLT